MIDLTPQIKELAGELFFQIASLNAQIEELTRELELREAQLDLVEKAKELPEAEKLRFLEEFTRNR